MVVIDTDVLLLAFAFHRDKRQTINNIFLENVQSADPAITIYNLMETLGKLSFNFSSDHLTNWSTWLVDAYQLTIIWPLHPEINLDGLSLYEELYARPFSKMRRYGMPFLDALILNLAERTDGVTHFVTWNARHFQGKSKLAIVTPEDYLQ